MARSKRTNAEQPSSLFSEDGDEVFTAIGRALERVARAHHKMLVDALQPFKQAGIAEVTDFRLLALLRRNPAGARLTDLAEELQMSKGAISARVERFAKLGIIVRESTTDRRVSVLRLSPDANDVTDQAGRAVMEVHRQLLGSVDQSDLDVVARVLSRCERPDGGSPAALDQLLA